MDSKEPFINTCGTDFPVGEMIRLRWRTPGAHRYLFGGPIRDRVSAAVMRGRCRFRGLFRAPEWVGLFRAAEWLGLFRAVERLGVFRAPEGLVRVAQRFIAGKTW